MYDGFAVLVGHLVGDFILQNDRTARFKGYPWPDRNACPDETATWWVATGMCVWHCLLYTVVIAAFAGWLTWWGAAACFAAHFVIDRFRLGVRAVVLRIELLTPTLYVKCVKTLI